jgi:hemerythrin superfamily protein
MTSGSSSTRRTTSRTRRSSSTKNAPDALRLLKDDHARVQALFGEFEKTESAKKKESLASTICDELTLHAQLEEKIFYPAVRQAIEDEDIMNEADVEHASAKELIAKIRACDASDQHFDAMVTVLREAIKHHIKEEEGEMFEQVRGSDLDLEELGERMSAFKREAR